MLVRPCSPVAGRRRRLPCLLLTVLIAAQGGCSLTGTPPGTAGTAGTDADTASPQLADSDADEEGQTGGWVEQAGDEARGNQRRVKDPDPWWGQYFISDEHRSIERNLGIDYD